MKYSTYLIILFILIGIACQGPESTLEPNNAQQVAKKSLGLGQIVQILDKGQYEEALSLSQQLPESGYKYNFIGVAYRHLGNQSEAIENFNKALNSPGEKNKANIYINLGHALSEKGLKSAGNEIYHLAFSELNTAIQEADDDEKHLIVHKIGLTHLYLDNSSVALGYFEEALSDRLALSAEGYLIANSYNYLAYASYLAGDLDKSLHYINLASEIQHNSIKIKLQTKAFAKIINSNGKNGEELKY